MLGPKFSKRERRPDVNLSRFNAIVQIEYCRFVPGNKITVRTSVGGCIGPLSVHVGNFDETAAECALKQLLG